MHASDIEFFEGGDGGFCCVQRLSWIVWRTAGVKADLLVEFAFVGGETIQQACQLSSLTLARGCCGAFSAGDAVAVDAMEL